MFTNETVKAIQIDINAALEVIAAKHGINSLKIDGGTKSPNLLNLKIVGVAGGEAGETVESAHYKRNQEHLKLPPFGAKFMYQNKEHEIVGLSKTGKNIHAKEVGTGKVYVFKTSFVIKETGGTVTAPAPALPLADFVKQVNALSAAEAEQINRSGRSMFAARHIDLPEGLLRFYHEQGLTPKETLAQMRREQKAEGRAEARAS